MGKILIVGIIFFVAGAAADTVLKTTDSLSGTGYTEKTGSINPYWSAAASAIIPGAGQFRSGKYLKSAFFISSEAIIASTMWYWDKEAKDHHYWADRFRNMADNFESDLVRREYCIESNLRIHKSNEARVRFYNSMSWMIGNYVFNVMDALGSTGVFRDFEKRSPVVAGWLSAIPGLGLGQIYNGALSKAGFITMTQVSLAVSAYNYQRLITKAEEGYRELYNKTNDEEGKLLRNSYLDDWTSNRGNAFRNRNMYLWYSVFFYFYGIFDAVVDAHLHDYPKKMEIQPDLTPDGMKLSLQIVF